MSTPAEIELPNAENFCRGQYRNSRGQCCFAGWQQKLLPELDYTENTRFRVIAKNEALKMHLHSGYGDASFIGITRTNDDKRNTKEQLANWFAQTVRVFGYDIS